LPERWCRRSSRPISVLLVTRSLRPREIRELTRVPAEPPGG
jgi:hypothetical protein